MNSQEIIRENRKVIIIGILTTIVLFIVMFVLIAINYDLDAKDKYVANPNASQPAASESDLDPSQYLKELHSVINQEYGERMSGYQIAEGKLLEDGTWYVTTIYQPAKTQWDLPTDTYRIILHQESNKWKIVAEPNLVFSYADFPDIPRGIIRSANEL
ncbi:hypothetical protein IKD98_00125 [Candidatus Saccharibacteria bacterium]|nr:hypothetical protein [Candidatus Saccharibacteria bacterium]